MNALTTDFFRMSGGRVGFCGRLRRSPCDRPAESERLREELRKLTDEV